ncbi:MAG: hypothetical protein U0236_15590 [Nitrospira sp.]
MMTVKSRFGHLTVEAITFVFVLGALSMIWPAIIALFLGVLALLQWFSADPEIVMLSSTGSGNLPIFVTSLRPWSSVEALMTSSSGAFVS